MIVVTSLASVGAEVRKLMEIVCAEVIQNWWPFELELEVSHWLSSAFRSESKAILIIRSWKELSKVSKVSSCHGNHGELSHLATTTDNNCYRNRISDRSYFISLSWS